MISRSALMRGMQPVLRSMSSKARIVSSSRVAKTHVHGPDGYIPPYRYMDGEVPTLPPGSKVPGRVIVELNPPPRTATEQHLKEQLASFFRRLNRRGAKWAVHATFVASPHIFFGACITVEELPPGGPALRDLKGVSRVHPVHVFGMQVMPDDTDAPADEDTSPGGDFKASQ